MSVTLLPGNLYGQMPRHFKYCQVSSEVDTGKLLPSMAALLPPGYQGTEGMVNGRTHKITLPMSQMLLMRNKFLTSGTLQLDFALSCAVA